MKSSVMNHELELWVKPAQANRACTMLFLKDAQTGRDK